jgi:membrane-associated HD superfamily phosphohydrolase
VVVQQEGIGDCACLFAVTPLTDCDCNPSSPTIMDDLGIVVVTYLSLIITITTISSLLFYKRRHMHPLRGRNPIVVLFTNIALTPLVVIPLIQRFGTYPCIVSLLLLSPVYTIAPSMVLIRGITLLFQFGTLQAIPIPHIIILFLTDHLAYAVIDTHLFLNIL